MIHWAHASVPSNSNGISIDSAVFAQSTRKPNANGHEDRLLDTQTTESAKCVAIDRISEMHATRPKRLSVRNKFFID